ncbi:MAG: hypothetical protein K8F91_04725, partial [Candidatus Obscuribacterales bacterium]|nr:hypothetical protein [Candidatus Obscuribacterales bacterium]
SGIMEIGDIFVVNKGDLPGANKSASEIIASLELSYLPTAWCPPVLVAVSESGEGVDKIWTSVKDHGAFLHDSGLLESRREAKVKAELSEIVADMARQRLDDSLSRSSKMRDTLSDVVSLKLDPHTAAGTILNSIIGDANSLI